MKNIVEIYYDIKIMANEKDDKATITSNLDSLNIYVDWGAGQAKGYHVNQRRPRYETHQISMWFG